MNKQIDLQQKISTDDQMLQEIDQKQQEKQGKEWELKGIETQSTMNETSLLSIQKQKDDNHSILTSSSSESFISSQSPIKKLESLSPIAIQKSVYYRDASSADSLQKQEALFQGQQYKKNQNVFIMDGEQDEDDDEESQEEEKVNIKNLDNGTVSRLREFPEDAKISMVNEKDEETNFNYFVIPKNKNKKTSSQRVWQKYWKEIQRFNDDLFDYSSLGEYENLKNLLERQHKFTVSINIKQIDDWTALHHACANGHLNVVNLLLRYKAYVNAKSVQKYTPLHLSAQRGNYSIVKSLIKNGADLDAQDKDLNTALHYAASIGQKEIVLLLLENKCNFQCLNMYQQTPLDCSSSREVLQVFLDNLQIDLDAYIQRSIQIYGNSFYKNKLICNSRVEHVNKILFLTKKFKDLSFNTSNNKPEQLNEELQLSFDQQNNNNKNGKLGSNNSLSQIAKSTDSLEAQASKSHSRKKKRSQKNLVKIEQLIVLNKQNSSFRLQKTLSGSPTPKKERNQDVGPEDFIVIDELGKGAFGKVYKVKKRDDGKIFAMKALIKEKVFGKNLVKYAKTERNVLSQIKHPFVVRLHYAFQTENRLYFVMDYCPGGDLDQQLFTVQRFKENHAKLYLAEILLALEALHDKGIIYRDLKPGNIVLDKDGHAMLTDFGLSKQGVNQNDVLKSFCGSIAYLAPEMLDKQGHNFNLDWYLFGVLAFELLSGYPPFYNDDKERLLDNIRNAKLKFPNYFSRKAKDFIGQLMRRNPSTRLGALNGAQDIKNHSFFSEVNWDKVYNKVYKPPKLNKDLFMLDTGIEKEMKITFSTNNDKSKRQDQENENKFLMNWSFAIQEQQDEDQQ